MILMGERCSKDRHHPVAYHSVDGAFIVAHGCHHGLQDWVKRLARLLGVSVGQQLHRALQVGKEHRDLFAFAFEGGTGGQDFLGEVSGGVGAGRMPLYRRWGRGWRSRGGVAGPHQDFAIFIDGYPLGIDEFRLEILEGVIIEIELPLERAIGHATSTLEHGQGLVQNLLEGHGRPSTALALPRADGTVFEGAASYGNRSTSIPEAWGSGTANCICVYRSGHWHESVNGGTVPEKRQGHGAVGHPHALPPER
jgi:hypothetical protein